MVQISGNCGVNIYNILHPQSCFRNVTCATVSVLICYFVMFLYRLCF